MILSYTNLLDQPPSIVAFKRLTWESSNKPSGHGENNLHRRRNTYSWSLEAKACWLRSDKPGIRYRCVYISSPPDSKLDGWKNHMQDPL